MYKNEEGAEVVRRIFHKFVEEGKGTHRIAQELLEEGIKPMRAKIWHNTVILRILRNETPDYLSHDKKYNRGQEEFVILRNHHTPVISRELFQKANAILDQKSRKREGIQERT